jgi:hypothetical protein
MKEKIKELFNFFSTYILWFGMGVAIIFALDLANFLMTYPSDITFFAGLFIYTMCIGAIGYTFYSIITNNLNKNKNKNEN